MSYSPPAHFQPAGTGRFGPMSSLPTISGMIARYKAGRAYRKATRDLAVYSDAQLADIGIRQADLMPTAYEKAADKSARAMLRVFS